MTSLKSRRLQATVLGMALLLPATTVLGNEWSKPKSRLKGTAIGATAGAIVGGPPGAVIGAGVGNGVQYLRHMAGPRHYRRHHYRRY